MEKERIIYLDVLRVLACCMVVLMHTPHPQAGVPGYVQVPIYFLTAAGLVAFFMVSGALLLPTKMQTADFLKRRVGKIVGPWLLWTIFYIVVNINVADWSFVELEKLFVMVSSPGRHIMWFMWALLGLYLITPILSKFVQNASKKEVSFYLLLWCITLALPWLSPYTGLDLGVTSPLYYFTGYVGYFLLGYYLHTYRPNIVKFAPLLVAIPLAAKLVYTLQDGQRSDELFWYLSVPVMLMSVALFTTVQKTCIRMGGDNSRLLTLMSDCSFGIYLVHFFIMRHVIWKIDFIVYGLGWLGQLMMTWTLTMIISFVLTLAISYLPYSEYIIGFTNRKKK